MSYSAVIIPMPTFFPEEEVWLVQSTRNKDDIASPVKIKAFSSAKKAIKYANSVLIEKSKDKYWVASCLNKNFANPYSFRFDKKNQRFYHVDGCISITKEKVDD